MMPSPETFSEACRKRGIRKTDHVVLYDAVGIFSAPRAAFTFDVGRRVCLGLDFAIQAEHLERVHSD